MARLIFLCIVAVMAWLGIRVIGRKVNRVYTGLHKTEDKQNTKEKIQPLKKDKDGVYRLEDD